MLLALIAAILLWHGGFLSADDFPATLYNGLTRAALLVAVVILLAAAARATKPATYQNLSLVLLAVFWLDVLTHEPPQNPTVPLWVYGPDLAGELAMKPQPALGGSRPDQAAAEMRFMQVITSDPKDNFSPNGWAISQLQPARCRPEGEWFLFALPP